MTHRSRSEAALNSASSAMMISRRHCLASSRSSRKCRSRLVLLMTLSMIAPHSLISSSTLISKKRPFLPSRRRPTQGTADADPRPHPREPRGSPRPTSRSGLRPSAPVADDGPERGIVGEVQPEQATIEVEHLGEPQKDPLDRAIFAEPVHRHDQVHPQTL